MLKPVSAITSLIDTVQLVSSFTSYSVPKQVEIVPNAPLDFMKRISYCTNPA